MIHPLLGIALVLILLGSMMAGLRELARRIRIHPELIRKLLHIGMGLTTLSFPWLFQTEWPVITLAALAAGLLLALRGSARLRSKLGGVVDGVGRDSLGEVYFPIAVAALFVLAHRLTILYVIPMLLLTLGDAAAALIGTRYGTVHYSTQEGQKSAEGSLSFFLVAFLSVHVPLLIFTSTGRAESLTIGLTLGLLAMVLEALAWRGLDNLFIPLGGYVLLRSLLKTPETDLLIRFGVMAALVTFVLLWRQRTTLNDSALFGAALVGFLIWTIGGWLWLIAPLTLFCTYTLIWPRLAKEIPGYHGITEILQTTGIGVGWLFLAQTLHRPELLLPYTLSFAAHLAFIGLVRLRAMLPNAHPALLLGTVLLKSWMLLILPCLIRLGVTYTALLWALIAPIGITVAIEGALQSEPTSDGRYGRRLWLHQLSILAGSMIGLIPLVRF